jgi:hypothetical protein
VSHSFRLYWASATCSYLGDGVRVTALPLLAAGMSSSPAQVAVVAAAASLPWPVLGLAAGVLVDRVSRVRVMAVAQLTRAGAGVLAAVAVLNGRMGIPELAGFAAALGCCEVGYDIAAQAMLGELVPAQRLPWANGRLVAAEVTAFEFAGPMLGGVLFAVAAALPLGVDAATFLASASLLMVVGRRMVPRPTPTPTDSVTAQLLAGVRWFARTPLIRRLTLLSTAINFGTGGFYAVLVLYARARLGLGPSGYGVLIAVSAAGSLVAGGLAERMSTDRWVRRVDALTAPVIAGCFLLIAGLPLLPVVGAAMVAFGFMVSIFNVIAMSLRQATVPGELLGRVLSVHRVLCWGALPLGALLAGWVASGAGLRWAIAGCGVVVLVGWLAGNVAGGHRADRLASTVSTETGSHEEGESREDKGIASHRRPGRGEHTALQCRRSQHHGEYHGELTPKP